MGAMTEEGDWTLDSYNFEDIEVVTPGPDVAIIAYTVKQTSLGAAKSRSFALPILRLGLEEPMAGNVMRTAKHS